MYCIAVVCCFNLQIDPTFAETPHWLDTSLWCTSCIISIPLSTHPRTRVRTRVHCVSSCSGYLDIKGIKDSLHSLLVLFQKDPFITFEFALSKLWIAQLSTLSHNASWPKVCHKLSFDFCKQLISIYKVQDDIGEVDNSLTIFGIIKQNLCTARDWMSYGQYLSHRILRVIHM